MGAVLDKMTRMSFVVDTVNLYPMQTMPTWVEGNLYRYKFDFNDSIIVISGMVGKEILDQLGLPTKEISWKEISKERKGNGSRGYEIMTVFADGIPHKAIFYNR